MDQGIILKSKVIWAYGCVIGVWVISLAPRTSIAQVDVQNPLGKSTFLKMDGVGGYYWATGAALVSFLTASHANQYAGGYSYQAGLFNTYRGAETQAVMHNLGFELKVKPWFLVGLYLNGQHYYGNERTRGIGIKTGYRWYLFHKNTWSPFFEYSAGILVHTDRFPQGGTHLIFTPTYQVGLEWDGGITGAFRIGIGHLHMSTADLFLPNIGFDSNGVSISYSRLFSTE